MKIVVMGNDSFRYIREICRNETVAETAKRKLYGDDSFTITPTGLVLYELPVYIDDVIIGSNYYIINI